MTLKEILAYVPNNQQLIIQWDGGTERLEIRNNKERLWLEKTGLTDIIEVSRIDAGELFLPMLRIICKPFKISAKKVWHDMSEFPSFGGEILYGDGKHFEIDCFVPSMLDSWKCRDKPIKWAYISDLYEG